MKFIGVILAVSLGFFPGEAFSIDETVESHPKQHILVIGTGGTIAGVAIPGDPIHYDPGQLTVEAILKEIPEINKVFKVDGQQLVDPNAVTPENPKGYVKVASSYLLERHWLLLAKQINYALTQDYEAVVVLHGTDTIEETAFFLQLTVQSTKPVILVGAMRPSVGQNPADGPDNLRTAFRALLDRQSARRGVMIASHFRLYPGYDSMKVRSFAANIAGSDGKPLPSDRLPPYLKAANFGSLAEVHKNARPFYKWRLNWNSKHALLNSKVMTAKFDVTNETSLPLVPIIYQQIGNDAVELLQNYYFQQTPKIKSYVFAGSGACSLTRAVGTLITSMASDADLMFMRSGHVPMNWCQFTQNDTNPNTTGAATLSPQQVKILLQLLQLAVEKNVDLGELVAKQNGFRDKVRAYFSEHVIYPYHVGSFEPIHSTPPIVVRPHSVAN